MSAHEYESTIVIGSRVGFGRKSFGSPPRGGSVQAGIGAVLFEFRALGRKKRGALAHSALIEIRNHDDTEALGSIPIDLFIALSTKKGIIEHEHGISFIAVAEYLLPVAVKERIARIFSLGSPYVDVIAMETTGNLFKDIQIASAAEYLGLTAYTQRMFNMHWQRLKTTPPTKPDIEVLSNIHTSLGEKLLNVAAYDLAKLSWAGTLPNPDTFEKYLDENEAFGAMVREYYVQWEADAEAYAAGEERRRIKAEQQRLADEHAQGVAAKFSAKEKEERAKERANFEAIKKEDAEIGKIVRENMQKSGSKYTAREARYIWSTFGKRVPVAAGG
jgi:hypothetical protein